jgi:serine protease Do
MNETLLDLARTFASDANELAEVLRRATVEIRVNAGCGAGLVWGGGGLVVTNAHCAPSSGPLHLESEGRRIAGQVVAYSRGHDLALIEARVSAPMLELRDVDSLRVGELLFAHGHPLGIRDSLAMGVVHGVARDRRTSEPRFVVADVRLAPGNSGGPLVDARGRLVGINSMVVGGLGAAIPSSVVQKFVQRAAASRAA